MKRQFAAASRTAKDERAAIRQGHRAAEAHARVFAMIVRAMRDLAAIVDGEPGREMRRLATELKPRKRRGYQFKPMRVSPLR